MIKYSTLILLFFSGIVTAQQKPVVLGTLHFPPFVICDKEVVVDGLDIRIIKRLFGEINQALQLKCLPWKRGLHLTASGQIDGLFPAFYTNERARWSTSIATPLHFESFAIATLANNKWIFNNNLDLKGKTLAVDLGHFYSRRFSQMVKRGEVRTISVKHAKHGLQMLQRGIVDGYLGNITVIGYQAQKMQISNAIATLSHRLEPPKDSLLILSNKSSHTIKLLPRLNETLAEMRQQGEVQDITDQYLDIEMELSDLYCPQHLPVTTIDWTTNDKNR